MHGNYLAPSIEAAGLDPQNLPESDPSKMNFGSGGNQESKAWKDIWGCGQGIGAVTEVVAAGALVSRIKDEYVTATGRQKTYGIAFSISLGKKNAANAAFFYSSVLRRW